MDVLVGVLEDATGTDIVLERAAEEPTVYQDPQGRFTLPRIGTWERLETDGPFALLAVPGVDLRTYVLTVDTTDLAVAEEEALRLVGVAPEGLTTTGSAQLGAWWVRFYARGDGQGVTPLCQLGMASATAWSSQATSASPTRSRSTS